MTLPAASFTEHPDIAASLAIAGLKTTPGEEEASLPPSPPHPTPSPLVFPPA